MSGRRPVIAAVPLPENTQAARTARRAAFRRSFVLSEEAAAYLPAYIEELQTAHHLTEAPCTQEN